MTRRFLLLPFAGLVVLSGYLGLRAGQPLTETDVINHFAARYVATIGDGAQPSDCHAVVHPDPGVWMAVVCTHPASGVMTFLVDPAGRAVDPRDVEVPGV